jgi:hypothetical protein
VIEVPLIGTDEVALISDEDAWLLQFNWRLGKNGYAQRTARMARDIAHADAHPGMQVDHIDRNRLNDQRNNLRLVTPRQNSNNREMRSDNSSGFVGVHWRKGLGKWIARVVHNYKRYHLGCYDTYEEACEAVIRFKEERNGIEL